jgi:tripartite-type tricarboxylate transporter receptor subunit TctC
MRDCNRASLRAAGYETPLHVSQPRGEADMSSMRHAVIQLFALCCACGAYAAEVYPAKPVRVIASFGPGSTADLAARIISQQLAEQMGRSFVVDNRPGAAGTIGYATVAKAAPDGYTLMLGEVSLTMSAGLLKFLTYDVERDFTPIIQLIRTPMAFVVNPSVNATSMKELVALARANPGKLNYASVGVGSAVHMATELFKLAAQVNVTQVAYKTGGEMVSGLLSGETQMLLTTMPNVVGIVKSGKVRALAVTNEGKRSATMPDVPTMAEAGLPDVTVYTWAGLFAPRGVPREIVTKVHAEAVKALAVPAVRDRFVADGADIVGSTPQEFSAFVGSELKRWAGVIKSANIRTE